MSMSTVDVSQRKFILGIDYGSTHACATLYSRELRVMATHTRKVERIEGSDGSCELDPEGVWICFCRVIQGVLRDAGITPNQVACLGISVQRNSFLLWDRDTAKPRSRVISWQDLRATELTKKWNKSFFLRSLKAGGHILYWMTRSSRFKALASYRCRTTLACIRLKHYLDDRPSLLEDCRRGRVCYGCLETWFLWRLTNGKVFATDVSCASVSGMYDPFTRKWSGPLLSGLGIPHEILPSVHPTSHLFGYVEAGPLSISDPRQRVPVTGIIGDAQAATLTEDCLGPGQAKLTMGTGSFLNLSTGHKPRALMHGFYPVIGWASSSKFCDNDTSPPSPRPSWPAVTSTSFSSLPVSVTAATSSSSCNLSIDASDLTYLLEGSHANTGTLLEWLRNEGLFGTFAELEDKLIEGDRLDLDVRQNAFYVPVSPELLSRHQETLELRNVTREQRRLIGPDGILLGISLQWTEVDRLLALRAVVESIALNVRHMLDQCRKEAGVSPTELRVNGNVSLSNWLMQRLADVTNIPVERSEFVDSSCMGAAIAAGVGAGIWPDYSSATGLLHGRRGSSSEPRNTVCGPKRFLPCPSRIELMHHRYKQWCRARSTYRRKLRLTRFHRLAPGHRTNSTVTPESHSQHQSFHAQPPQQSMLRTARDLIPNMAEPVSH